MAYTTIDKPTDYFNTKLYTGTGATHAITGVGFQPDWVWIKSRSQAVNHYGYDSVRGTDKRLQQNITNPESTTDTTWFNSFDSDGFTIGSEANINNSSSTYASWNWLAGGTAPAITYTVKVVSDSGNKYRFDDFGTSAVTLDLQEGGTYTFDQSDSSNSGHPLRFSTTSDGSHGGGSEYTTGVTTTGTPGSAGAKTVITVASGAATLYYYCSSHSGMGGQANTNSTFGSSNFGGSIQANVSANTTAGFSIVSYTGNGTSGATIGHGLSSKPTDIFVKARNDTTNWASQHKALGATKFMRLNDTRAVTTDTARWNDTEPTTSVFSVGNDSETNQSANTYVAYCFAPKQGFSKFGSYTGNGNNDGTYVHLGFRPAWIMIKRTNSTQPWCMWDNKRNTFNLTENYIYANDSGAEGSGASIDLDMLSNGFKLRNSGAFLNTSGDSFIYMAFAESPFVTSTGIPTTAR